MNIIEYWEYITNIERVPFLAEHWYLVVLPWLIPLIVIWLKEAAKSRYIHYTDSNATCSTCSHCSSRGYCSQYSCQIYSPDSKTCDYYE